jgi:hypothetical protein
VVTAVTIEPAADTARDSKGAVRRAAGAARRQNSSRGEANASARFFLGKVDGRTPVLDREMPGENEALLESLKTGQSYFALSEWKAVADLSDKVPQIRKEAVRREERDHGLTPPAHGARSVGPTQAS